MGDAEIDATNKAESDPKTGKGAVGSSVKNQKSSNAKASENAKAKKAAAARNAQEAKMKSGSMPPPSDDEVVASEDVPQWADDIWEREYAKAEERYLKEQE